MHKHLRIFILLLILLIVAVGTWATKMRVTDWSHTLRVVIYPINADHSDVTAQYIQQLDADNFAPIKSFFIEELEAHKVFLEEPMSIALSSEVKELPPALPMEQDLFKIISWSLKLRYWAFKRDEYQGPKPEIQVFALYYDPATTPRVQHSTGLEKGQIAVINLFADKKNRDGNLFVIVHELLHTLGATDKYDRSNNKPIYPIGFAEPELDPLYPQTYAEVMGGRIPLNEGNDKIPDSLNEVIIGNQTAREIRLIQ